MSGRLPQFAEVPRLGLLAACLWGLLVAADAGEARFPPRLPGGKAVATETSPELLRAPPLMTLLGDVAIAKTPPTVDLLYYPCQTYRGNPWSCWGDGVAATGKALGVTSMFYNYTVSPIRLVGWPGDNCKT